MRIRPVFTLATIALTTNVGNALIKPVLDHHNALCCDSICCNIWLNLKCTNVSLRTYNMMHSKKYTEQWFCKNFNTFPFCDISDLESSQISSHIGTFSEYSKNLPMETSKIYSDICSVCQCKINGKLLKLCLAHIVCHLSIENALVLLILILTTFLENFCQTRGV